MTNNNPHIYTLVDTFFKCIEISRLSEVPDPLEMEFDITGKVMSEYLPNRLEVHLGVTSRAVDEANDPVHVDVELVGIFELVDKSQEVDDEMAKDYLTQIGFFLLLPYIEQLVRVNSSLMGMRPLKISIPHSVEVGTVN